MSQTWVSPDILVSTRKPPARHGHATAIDDHRKSVIVHGGRDDKTSEVFADLYSLSYAGVRPGWSQLCEGSLLPKRYNHSMCMVRNVLLLFAGLDENHTATDTLFTMSMDELKMTRATTKGVAPCARSEHAMVVVDDMVVLYGGKDVDGNALSDVFVLEPTEDLSLAWRHIDMQGAPPSPRWCAQLWRVDANRVYVFGGCNASGSVVTDMFLLDVRAWTWSLVAQRGDMPLPTQRYRGVHLADDDIIFVLGEKGPLRVYYISDVVEQGLRVTWQTYKASGALPALEGFALASSPPATSPVAIIMGGRPFVAKDGGMQVWMLDTGCLLSSASASAAAPAATQSPLAGMSFSGGGSSERNKYNSLRHMFRRGSAASPPASSSRDASPAPLSPVASPKSHSKRSSRALPVETAAAASAAPASAAPALPPKSARTSSTLTAPLNTASSPSLRARDPDRPSSTLRSVKSGDLGKSRHDGDISGATAAGGLASPTSRRHADSMGVALASSPPPTSPFAMAATTAESASSARGVARSDAIMFDGSSPRSPHNAANDAELELVRERLATTLKANAFLQQELDDERKRATALRDEIDKAAGKTDVSLLMRKALDDEVKRSTQLAGRVEALEREVVTATFDKKSLLHTMDQLKKVIATQGTAQSEAEAKITALQAQVLEVHAGRRKIHEQASQITLLAAQLEQERIARMVSDLRASRTTAHTRELAELLLSVRNEFRSCASQLLHEVRDGDARSALEWRLRELDEGVTLRLDSATLQGQLGTLNGAAAAAAAAAPDDIDDSSGDDELSDDDMASSPFSTPRNDSGALTSVAPKTPGVALPLNRHTRSTSLSKPRSGNLLLADGSPRFASSDLVGRHLARIQELELLNTTNEDIMESSPQAALATGDTTPSPSQLHDLAQEAAAMTAGFCARLHKAVAQDDPGRALLVSEALLLETSYLTDLAHLETTYRAALVADALLPAVWIDEMFSCLPALLEAHKRLLPVLVAHRSDTVAFLTVYADAMHDLLGLYDAYTENLTLALTRFELVSLRSRRFRRFLRSVAASQRSRVLNLRIALCLPLVHLNCYADLFERFAGDGGLLNRHDGGMQQASAGSADMENVEAVDESMAAAAAVATSPRGDKAAASDDVNGEDESVRVLVAAIYRRLAPPSDMYQDVLERACVGARLRVLEIRAGVFADEPLALAQEGRTHLSEAEFVVVEAGDDGHAHVLQSLLVVLCSDALFMFQPVPEKRGVLRLHEVVPLHLMQLQPSPHLATEGIICLCNKAKPTLQYSLHASGVGVAKAWADLLKAAAGSAAQRFVQRSKLKEARMESSSSSSGWDPSVADTSRRGDAARHFEDTASICYTKDAQTGHMTVRGGLPSALVLWLINDVSGPTATQEVLQFLQACEKAVPAPVIFATAVEQLERAGDVRQRVRVLNFLALWTSEFCHRDMLCGTSKDGALFHKMVALVIKWSAFPELVNHVNPIKLGLLRGHADKLKAAVGVAASPATTAKAATTPAGQDSEGDIAVGAADLEEIKPVEFAEQLTLLVHGLFAALSDDDLYQGDRSPNVVAMIKQWNVLSEWCIGYLNSGSNGADDAAQLVRVRRMLAIAKRCLELGNFDSVFAIGLALDQARIAKTARDSVGKAGQDVWDSLVHITNFSRGFANYRALLDSLAPPAIPYLAIFLKDVVLIRENDNFIENTELLNYRKLVILGSRFRFARRFQRVPYDFLATIESVQAALRAPKQYAKLPRGSASPAAAAAAAAATLNMSRMSQDLSSSGGGGSAPESSRSITGKLQQLRSSVKTTAERLQFFTPRDTTSSSAARESREKAAGAAKTPLTARAKKSGSPFATSDSGSDTATLASSPGADDGNADTVMVSPTTERKQRAAGNNGWSRAAPKDGVSQPSTSLTLRRGSLLQSAGSSSPTLSRTASATLSASQQQKFGNASDDDAAERHDTDGDAASKAAPLAGAAAALGVHAAAEHAVAASADDEDASAQLASVDSSSRDDDLDDSTTHE